MRSNNLETTAHMFVIWINVPIFMFITHIHKHAHTKPNSIHTQKQILITHIISDDELSILKYYKVYVEDPKEPCKKWNVYRINTKIKYKVLNYNLSAHITITEKISIEYKRDGEWDANAVVSALA